ncbi:MAG: hypothetical protein ABIR67_10500 [Gaiellaceae bacterium]
MSMGVAVAPISPELALVCPELRERALALLPTLDPDALFEVSPRRIRPVRERPELVCIEREPRAPLPVAAAAYATEALVLGALRGAALTTVIAALAFLLAW